MITSLTQSQTQRGGDTIYLGSGEYSTYDASVTSTNGLSSTKSLTFIGAGASQTTWNIGADTSHQGIDSSDCSFSGTESITFKNLKLKTVDNHIYNGFAGVTNITVENGIVEGHASLWGTNTTTFSNVEFIQTTSGQYIMWTQNGRTTDYYVGGLTYYDTTYNFINCTFNGVDRFIKVYNDKPSGKKITVNIENCTFNYAEGVTSGKAAVEIDDSQYGEGNIVNFKGTNTFTGGNLFNASNGTKTTVTINDEIVYDKGVYSSTHHDAVEATCTTDGNVEYYERLMDHTYYSDSGLTEKLDTVVVSAAHDYVHHDLVSATLEISGMKEHYTCSKCDAVFDADKNLTTSNDLVIEQLKAEPTTKAVTNNKTLVSLAKEVNKITEMTTKAVKEVADNLVNENLSVDGFEIPQQNISEVKVVLNVETQNEVTEETKQKVQNIVSEYETVQSYVDVTVTAVVVDHNGETVSSTTIKDVGTTNIPVTLSLADIDLNNTFIKIAHVHVDDEGNTTTTFLPATIDKENMTVTVDMSKFSTLAIVTSKTTDVSYISEGKTCTTQTVAYNNALSKPTDPTRSGYTFNGWYVDEAYTNAYDFSTGVTTESMKLYAKWTKNSLSSNSDTTVKKVDNSSSTTTTTTSSNTSGYRLVQTDVKD